MDEKPRAAVADFLALDVRVGTVLAAEPTPRARKPAYLLRVDFGPLGIRETSAQITERYTPESLRGRQVVAIVNFPPKQIASVTSECLVLGAVGEGGGVDLLRPDGAVPDGTQVS